MPLDVTDLVAVVETWQIRRLGLATKGKNHGFTQDGLYEFVEVHSALARKLVSLVGRQDPEFWSAWIELGTQASTIVTGAKTIANHIDRTNL